MNRIQQLKVLQDEIVACVQCPRLIAHSRAVAIEKRRAFRDWDYWGKPVPSFGDPEGRVLILGLAPGAHGSNRTGRMFTGDASGEILYRVLHETGFASIPTSVSREDGQTLTDAYITAGAHCAPPGNKPTPEEFRNCRVWLEREIDLLPDVRVVVALGKLAFDLYLSILKDRGVIGSRSPFVFAHDREYRIPGHSAAIVSSYHPSQQNTSTGKLTEEMLRAVFVRARRLMAE